MKSVATLVRASRAVARTGGMGWVPACDNDSDRDRECQRQSDERERERGWVVAAGGVASSGSFASATSAGGNI